MTAFAIVRIVAGIVAAVVDRLRAAGAIVRASPEYQRLLRDLAKPAEAPASC
jgi:hypothetical protein